MYIHLYVIWAIWEHLEPIFCCHGTFLTKMVLGSALIPVDNMLPLVYCAPLLVLSMRMSGRVLKSLSAFCITCTTVGARRQIPKDSSFKTMSEIQITILRMPKVLGVPSSPPPLPFEQQINLF